MINFNILLSENANGFKDAYRFRDDISIEKNSAKGLPDVKKPTLQEDEKNLQQYFENFQNGVRTSKKKYCRVKKSTD